ncbi:MAG: hypothetical protein QOE70_4005 [Chthoniobacter sp.]|jgi:hypothetical protein|nr:hypothetical protein [Chthoniobacter sp.]
MKSVEIEISTEGEVKIEAIDFKGKVCELATAPFEEALGVVKTRSKKKEYHQQTTGRQGQRT